MDSKELLAALTKEDGSALKTLARSQQSPAMRDLYAGAAALVEGDNDTSLSLVQRATVSDPENWLAHYLLARLYVKVGSGRKSVDPARRAFKLSNARIDATLLYIHTLLDTGEIDQVIELVQGISEKQRRSRPLLMALASSFRSKGMYEEAIKYAEQLLELDNEHPTSIRIKADIVSDFNSEEGVPLYEKSLALSLKKKNKIDHAARWNSSLHFLRLRKFSPGWDYWDSGFSPEVGTMGRVIPEQLRGLQRIRSEPIDPERWVLLIPEQGIGDQILFLTGLRQLLKESQRYILVCDHRMHAILSRSYPEILTAYPGLIDQWATNSLKKQGILPYGSILPRYIKEASDFMSHKAIFLRPDTKKVEKMRSLIKKRSGDKKIVGISWIGGYWEQQKRNKGIPLEHWAPLFDERLTIVNLQYGDINDDLQFLKKKGWPIIQFTSLDFKEHLDDWLALMHACDRIVSVSTALVHFSGASGVQTDILMPSRQGPWILGMGDNEHIAYMNTKICRNHEDKPLKEFMSASLERIRDEVLHG